MIAFLIAYQFAGLLANAQALTVKISVSKTQISEAAPFTATITVENTGPLRANDVYLYSKSMVDSLDLDAGGTGFAQPTGHVSPLISAISPGKTMRFVQKFKATTSGTFRLTCSVSTIDGTSAPAYSPEITVTPRKVGHTARSDSGGSAMLTIGRTKIPIHLTDEETGSSLSGLALGLALDPLRKGQAVLAAVDPLGRYPTQFVLLQGATAAVTQGARARPTAAAVTTGAPVDIPLDQSCGGDGEAFTRVMAPIPTTYLPPVKPLVVPPPDSQAKRGDDRNQPTFAVMLDASKAALATSKGLLVKRQVVPCDQVLEEDANAIKEMPADSAGEFMVYTPIEKGIELLAPETSGVLVIDEALRTASSAEGILSTFHDFYLCNVRGAEVLSAETILPSLPQYSLLWNSPVAPDSSPVPLTELSLAATDSDGNPISGGSIQLVSYDELGLGVRGIIGDGSADVPVPVGNYNWCVRAPGYQTQSGQISITSTAAAIQVALLAQPIASATLTTDLGQPTGFLPKGTQFVLTPHFFDANGNPVSCTGTAVFQVDNPVGTDVASVDPDTGLVTILDGCGAAKVTVWCNGVQSAPALISSDCKGTEPLPASPSFALFPREMTFTAKQGGSNPPSQSLYLVILTSSGTLNSTATWSPSSWLTFTPGNIFDTVSVKVGGLLAGTYEGSITIKDNNNPKFHATVHVNLIIEQVPTAQLAGTWKGTYSIPYDDVGDAAQYNIIWVLDQNGNSVSGQYGEIEFGSTQQTNGELNDGQVDGNFFSIYDDGGLEFVGTVGSGGSTITGSVETGSNFPGSFSVKKQ